ncbi:MAG: hypothetical protein WAN28_00890, partial [Terracidiphilus sp.]
GLRRLLGIRELLEEQEQAALVAARAELSRLGNALEAATTHARHGRALVNASLQTGDVPDRLAGLAETQSAERVARVVIDALDGAQRKVDEQEHKYLFRRVERRQAEAMVQTADAAEARQVLRRAQQALDEWFRSRGRENKEQ